MQVNIDDHYCLTNSFHFSIVTAGHIFATDCNQYLLPRGLSFVKDVRANVQIPVFAIGGINENNLATVLAAGADGVCLMSAMMPVTNRRNMWIDREF